MKDMIVVLWVIFMILVVFFLTFCCHTYNNSQDFKHLATFIEQHCPCPTEGGKP